MMNTFLFNPFKFIAGGKALFLGWLIMLLTALVAYYSKAHFDGVIDAHKGLNLPLPWYFVEQLLAWLPAVLIFYLTGRFFSPSAIRFIDIAGTMALARAPMIFVAILNFAMLPFTDIRDITASMIALALIVMLFSIWMIALMYNAFAVSANLKGSKSAILFIASMVIAEILSKILFHQLYLHIVK